MAPRSHTLQALIERPGRTPRGSFVELLPITWRLVVAIDRTPVVRRPLEFRTSVVGGRVLQQLLVQVDHVPTLRVVVLQSRPRQWMELLTHAEKTAERHHRINRATTDFVNHDVIDGAELFPAKLKTVVPLTFCPAMRVPVVMEVASVIVKLR